MAIRFLANINQPAPGSEPYLTDLSSITLLKDLLPGFNVSSNPRGFTLLPDGRVVFGAFNGSTTELWITNGTEAGTVRPACKIWRDRQASRATRSICSTTSAAPSSSAS